MSTFVNKKYNNKFDIFNEDSDDDNKVILKKEKSKNITKSLDDNPFKQFNKNNKYTYSKNKDTTFTRKFEKNTIDEDFVPVINKKKEKIIAELFYPEINDSFLDTNMDSYYRVLGHHLNDKNWTYLSYHNMAVLSKWSELASFFNTFNSASGECKYIDFDTFIFKNEITPMWEDYENRNGYFCSIKIDSLEEGYIMFKNITYHSINNTLLKFNPNLWNIINGISFSPKKNDHLKMDSYCVIIKIWFKINILNFGIIEKLLNDDIMKEIIDKKYSLKVKPIQPEF